MIGWTLVLFTMSSCAYNSEESLYPEGDCNFENVSYTEEVLPIITEHCYGCHNAAANFGNVNVEGHEQISIYVSNGELLGSIRHASGFSPMPQSRAQLVECDIERIAQWIEEGAPNN